MTESKGERRRRAVMDVLRACRKPIPESRIMVESHVGGANLSHALVGLLHAGRVRYVGNRPYGERSRFMWQAVGD